MLGVTINGKDYDIKVEHEDFTIQDAINIRIKLDAIPKNLFKLYENLIEERKDENKEKLEKEQKEITDSFTPQDLRKTFPIFYGDIIQLSSDIPEAVMKLMPADWRTRLYESCCIKNVCELLGSPKYIDPAISFTQDDIKYFAPEPYEILNEVRPMGKNTRILEFAESADLELFSEELKGGKYSVLPNIISILYRPKDEEYNEATSLTRVEKFKQLDMKIGWGVFFYFKQLETISLQNIRTLEVQEQILILRRQLSEAGLTNSAGTDT